jgi:hypothetical protein
LPFIAREEFLMFYDRYSLASVLCDEDSIACSLVGGVPLPELPDIFLAYLSVALS